MASLLFGLDKIFNCWLGLTVNEAAMTIVEYRNDEYFLYLLDAWSYKWLSIQL